MKISITTIALVLAITISSAAQITGGGAERDREREPGADRSRPAQATASLFQRNVIMNFGWANPKGKFGIQPELGDSFAEIFSSQAGMGAQTGFSTGLYFLSPVGNVQANFLNSGLNVQAGFKYGFNYAQNKLDWTHVGGYWESHAAFEPYHFIDFKAGVLVAINPIGNLIVDVFYNPMFSIVIPGEIVLDYTETTNQYTYSHSLQIYDHGDPPPMGLRNGIGFQIRLNSLIFSVETTWGEIEYHYEYEFASITTNGVFDSEYTQESYQNDMTNNITKITFGLTF